MTVYWERGSCFRLSAEDQKVLDTIIGNAERQRQHRESLKEKISGVIAGCTTVKTAKARLPEFAKYLPEEVEKTQNLPAIANLVADLTKLGWPKDAAQAAA